MPASAPANNTSSCETEEAQGSTLTDSERSAPPGSDSSTTRCMSKAMGTDTGHHLTNKLAENIIRTMTVAYLDLAMQHNWHQELVQRPADKKASSFITNEISLTPEFYQLKVCGLMAWLLAVGLTRLYRSSF
jgi:hypothetical protein